jgi:hypothetical protein
MQVDMPELAQLEEIELRREVCTRNNDLPGFAAADTELSLLMYRLRLEVDDWMRE